MHVQIMLYSPIKYEILALYLLEQIFEVEGIL